MRRTPMPRLTAMLDGQQRLEGRRTTSHRVAWDTYPPASPVDMCQASTPLRGAPLGPRAKRVNSLTWKSKSRGARAPAALAPQNAPCGGL